MKGNVRGMTRESIGLLALLVSVAPWTFGHDPVDYETEIQPIFTSSCGGAGCHIGEAASGVNLSTHASLMKSFGELYESPPVVPGDWENSPLYLKLLETPLRGAIMPPDGSLPATSIEKIKDWIEEGARPTAPELVRGDANGDAEVNLTDVIFLLNGLFRRGSAPSCRAAADCNADGDVNVSDAVQLVLTLFAGAGPLPPLTHEEEDACRVRIPELSFRSIHEKIFFRSCSSSSCHSVEGAKGGLVLETLDLAYENLVGVSPENVAANEAGSLRVDPGRLDNSFLLRKLTEPGLGEGNRMPLAARALSEDKIQAIREWINARAPREGTIPGVPDIADTPAPPPDRIASPPVPENGMQIHLEPFQIAPGAEREIFKLVDPQLTEDVIVTRFDMYMTEDSHHFILYTWNDPNNLPPPGLREATDTTGVGSGNHTGLFGSQTSFHSRAFPEGYGVRVRAGTLFDLNSHYLNLAGDTVLLGEVYINLFFAEPGTVTDEVRSILIGSFDLFIPPGETRTVGQDWRVSRETRVHVLSSHTHRHGVYFRITYVRNDGSREVVYENHDWDDPHEENFNPPMVMQPGERLRYECTHTNDDRDVALRFGLTSEDEMCFMTAWISD